MNSLVWNRIAAQRYLNDFPLPTTFTWPHKDGGERPVHPVHAQVLGWGKWLAETPNYPGLFELIVDILNDKAVREDPGDGVWLAAQLTELRTKHEKSLSPSTAALAHRIRPFVGAPEQPELFKTS